MPHRVLDADRADALGRLCELFVPGSGRVGPVTYIDAHLAVLPPEVQGFAVASIASARTSANSGVRSWSASESAVDSVSIACSAKPRRSSGIPPSAAST